MQNESKCKARLSDMSAFIIDEVLTHSLALILSRKLSFLNKICVTTVIIERYYLQNDSGCHLNDA